MIHVQKLVFQVWMCDGFLNQQTGVPQWATGFANQSINQSDENPKIPSPLVWTIVSGLFLTLPPCLLCPTATALNMVVVIEKTWQSSGLTLCQNNEKKYWLWRLY